METIITIIIFLLLLVMAISTFIVANEKEIDEINNTSDSTNDK